MSLSACVDRPAIRGRSEVLIKESEYYLPIILLAASTAFLAFWIIAALTTAFAAGVGATVAAIKLVSKLVNK